MFHSQSEFDNAVNSDSFFNARDSYTCEALTNFHVDYLMPIYFKTLNFRPLAVVGDH